MKILLNILLFSIAFQSYAQISDFNHIDFKKADSIALAHSDEELYNLPQLAFLLTSNLDTEAEKFRAIYFWVCHNISNNYSLYLKNKHKRNRFKTDSAKLKAWNNKFRKLLFKKLLKRKTTICTGYAYMVKELAQLANLECEIVQGYGRVSTTDIENLDLPNHSWNAIKLNDKWYLSDPTWASGIPNPKTNLFRFQYNDGFFLANPKLFAINHFPVNSKWWLLDTDIPTFKNFLASPVIYGGAYKNLNTIEVPRQMHQTIKKFDTITFKAKLKNTINHQDVRILIDNGVTNLKIKPQVVFIKDNVLTTKHQFKKSGFYDFHLYIGDDLIFTYTISVKK